MNAQSLREYTRFSDFLKPGQVIYDLAADAKVKAIEELLDILVKQKLVTNKKLVLTRVIDRENLEATTVGQGIALPHARVDTEEEIAVAVGRSAKGIDFGAPDGQRVHLIILVVWNPRIPGLFNHLFAGLAGFLIKPENRWRIFEAEDKNALYKTLSEIEFKFALPEDRIIHRAGLLRKLQDLEIRKQKASREQQKDLQKQAELIREELDAALLTRFDRLMQRYGFAVAEVVDGVCQSCNINLSTQMYSAIEGSNDIYVCENCGKFLVSPARKPAPAPAKAPAKATAKSAKKKPKS